MDTAARFASRPLPGISGAVSGDRNSLKSDGRVSFVRVGNQGRVLRNVFCDSSHLQYYVSGERKETKVKKKLIKRLPKDLAFISRTAYAGDVHGLVGDVKGKMISEAAEVLLAEVRHLKAERKEQKRRRKAEKVLQQAMSGSESSSSSSSSSSESSDDDCQEVIKLSRFTSNLALEKSTEVEPLHGITNEAALAPTSIQTQVENERVICCSGIGNECSSSNSCNDVKISGIAVESTAAKIEVCMGGKCKKLGAHALMEELERKVGVEGAVVGCKCMGKCKNAPNVRVSSSATASVVQSINGDSSVTSATNPLFIGAGLKDVDTIVAHFAGNNSYEMMPC